jgi:hypothetical protein
MKFLIKANHTYISCEEKLELIYQVAEINHRLISRDAKLEVILPFNMEKLNLDSVEEEGSEDLQKLEGVTYIKVILPLSGDSAGIYLKNPSIEASFIDEIEVTYEELGPIASKNWKIWPLSISPAFIDLRDMIDFEFGGDRYED